MTSRSKLKRHSLQMWLHLSLWDARSKGLLHSPTFTTSPWIFFSRFQDFLSQHGSDSLSLIFLHRRRRPVSAAITRTWGLAPFTSRLGVRSTDARTRTWKLVSIGFSFSALTSTMMRLRLRARRRRTWQSEVSFQVKMILLCIRILQTLPKAFKNYRKNK